MFGLQKDTNELLEYKQHENLTKKQTKKNNPNLKPSIIWQYYSIIANPISFRI